MTPPGHQYYWTLQGHHNKIEIGLSLPAQVHLVPAPPARTTAIRLATDTKVARALGEVNRACVRKAIEGMWERLNTSPTIVSTRPQPKRLVVVFGAADCPEI